MQRKNTRRKKNKKDEKKDQPSEFSPIDIDDVTRENIHKKMCHIIDVASGAAGSIVASDFQDYDKKEYRDELCFFSSQTRSMLIDKEREKYVPNPNPTRKVANKGWQSKWRAHIQESVKNNEIDLPNEERASYATGDMPSTRNKKNIELMSNYKNPNAITRSIIYARLRMERCINKRIQIKDSLNCLIGKTMKDNFMAQTGLEILNRFCKLESHDGNIELYLLNELESTLNDANKIQPLDEQIVARINAMKSLIIGIRNEWHHDHDQIYANDYNKLIRSYALYQALQYITEFIKTIPEYNEENKKTVNENKHDAKLENLYLNIIGALTLNAAEHLHQNHCKPHSRLNTNEGAYILPPDHAIRSKKTNIGVSNVLVTGSGTTACQSILKCIYGDIDGLDKLPSLDVPDGYKRGDITRTPATYFEWASNAKIESQPVVLIGRSSESKYILSESTIETLLQSLLQWTKKANDALMSQENPSKTIPTVVFDLTIEQDNDELWKILANDAIIKEIENGKLQIIVVKSEQKQQSLGTGKFSAGSAFLIAKNNCENIDKVNRLVTTTSAPDYGISNFYRAYARNAEMDICLAQTSAAAYMAKLWNKKIRSMGKKMIEECKLKYAEPTGCFLMLPMMHDHQPIGVGPLSYSFGFSQTSYAIWSNKSGMFRVSPGLESKKTLAKFVDQYFAKYLEYQVEQHRSKEEMKPRQP